MEKTDIWPHFKYWAFISYSHADRKWVDWLHRALETYRVPQHLVGIPSEEGPVPARVYPIFRDREELPVSADLPANINRALEQSRFLIVVCSPQSARSRWVNEEIITFKRLGRESRILPLIVAGEPNASEEGGKLGLHPEDECFPTALRYRAQPDGELSNVRTEPVAADARRNKDGKYNAKLKLLAGLLGLDFAQLRQREQERRIRRLSLLVAVAVVLLVVFGRLTVYSVIQRQHVDQADIRAKQYGEDALTAKQRSKAQLSEAAASDLATAVDLITNGKWCEGIAYLSRSLRYDPKNRRARAWFWNTIVYGSGGRNPLPLRLFPLQGAALGAVYSPDGTRVVTASFEKIIQQWNEKSGIAAGPAMRHGDLVASVAYSPDGAHLLTTSLDQTAQQWDAATAMPLGAPLHQELPLLGAIYSPDGARILTTSNLSTCQQWDAATGQPVGLPLRHKGVVSSAVYSLDGKYILTAGADKTARQWDAVTGQPVGQPLLHDHAVQNAVYSPDGIRIATVDADNSVRQWWSSTGQLYGKPLHHEDKIRSLIYSPDGLRILTVSGAFDTGTIAQQWKTLLQTQVGDPLRHEGGIITAAYSPDGTRILTAGFDQTVRQWDAVTGQSIGEPLRHQKPVRTAVYNGDGTRILTTSEERMAYEWDAATGRPLGEPLVDEKSVSRAVYSPDGARILTTGGEDAEETVVRQWDAATGQPVGAPLDRGEGIACAVYSPDSAHILTIGGTLSRDTTARQWDAVTGKPFGTPLPHDQPVGCAVYSPDGAQILTISGMTNAEKPTARRWNAATGEPVGEPWHFEHELTDAVYSPDGLHVFFSGVEAREFEVATGHPVGHPTSPNEGIVSAVYSHDGRRILAVSLDQPTQQWTATTGQPFGQPLPRAEDIAHASYNRDDTRILTAGSSAQQWDAVTGKPLGVPLRDKHAVSNAVYNPDGAHVLTSSYQDPVREWECDPPLPPPPPWLDEFAKVLCGLRLDASGELKNVPVDERVQTCTALRNTIHDGAIKPRSWEQLAAWSLSPLSEAKYTPGSSRTTVEVARRALATGGQDEIATALRLVPSLPLAHLALAALRNTEADFLQRYELQHLPLDVGVRLAAVAMLRRQNASERALLLAREIVNADPRNIEAWRQVASILQNDLKRPAKARQASARLAELSGATVDEIFVAALLCFAQNHRSHGRELMQLAETRFPTDPVVFCRQGQAFIALELPLDALKAFQKSEKMLLAAGEKSGVELLAGLASSYWLTGQEGDAVTTFQRLISIQADYANREWVNSLQESDAEKMAILAVLAETQRLKLNSPPKVL